DLAAGFGLELLDAERFALRHAVLLAAGDQYCVHDGASRVVRFCSYSLTWPPSRADRSGIVRDSTSWGQQAPGAVAAGATAGRQHPRTLAKPRVCPHIRGSVG